MFTHTFLISSQLEFTNNVFCLPLPDIINSCILLSVLSGTKQQALPFQPLPWLCLSNFYLLTINSGQDRVYPTALPLVHTQYLLHHIFTIRFRIGVGVWRLSQLSWCERRGRPSTSHQYMAALTQRQPINLTWMSLNCRRKI